MRHRMMAIGGCLLLAVCGWGGVVRALPAVTEIEIRNTGSGRLDEGFVRAHITVEAGQPLDARGVSRDVRALLDTGRFSDVHVLEEPDGGGVRLIYALRRRLTLAEPVAVEGAEHYRASRIRGWLGLEAGSPVDDQLIGSGARRVLNEYRKAHFPDVEATWTLEELDDAPGSARVRFTVSEGPRARVKAVRIEGNEKIPDRVLRRALKQPAWWNPLWWLKKRRYEPGELEAARLGIRALYLEEGCLDVEIGMPFVEPDEDGNLTVVVQVHAEGETYRFGDVELQGAERFPVETLRAQVPARPGDVARASAVEASVRALRDYYGGRGYLNTQVRPVLNPDAERRVVDMSLLIREGELTHVRNVYVRGNPRTKDKVIRREILVYPGDVYDEVRIELSRRRLMNLGYFSDVRAYPERTVDVSRKDLVFRVEEKRTGQFSVGAAYSSVDALTGFASIGQGNFDLLGWPNFTGGGQKLKLTTMLGGRRESYELSFVEPWFLDRQLALGVNLYHAKRVYDDYDLRRTGGSVSLTRALPWNNRLKLEYSIERMSLTDVSDTNRYVYADAPAEEFFFTTEEDATRSALLLQISNDTRNSPFFPTSGQLYRVFGRVAGGALGFDTDVYGLGLETRHYRPLWWGHVLSLNTRYEIVDEYGDTELMPIWERLFLGGGRTLRGFRFREVGPKVIRDVTAGPGVTATRHRPVGGRSLAMASAEYSVPLIGAIRLAAFYDIGNVWQDAGELRLNDLAESAGVGLRFDIPGFPIRIDYATVLEPDDEYSREDNWVIWIGYD